MKAVTKHARRVGVTAGVTLASCLCAGLAYADSASTVTSQWNTVLPSKSSATAATPTVCDGFEEASDDGSRSVYGRAGTTSCNEPDVYVENPTITLYQRDSNDHYTELTSKTFGGGNVPDVTPKVYAACTPGDNVHTDYHATLYSTENGPDTINENSAPVECKS